MSMSDPLSITINAVTTTLGKIRDDGLLSEYQSVDESLNLIVSHLRIQKTRRVKTIMKLVVKKNATDPISGLSVAVSTTYQWSMDRPTFGWTDQQIKNDVDGLNGLLTLVNVTKLRGLEH